MDPVGGLPHGRGRRGVSEGVHAEVAWNTVGHDITVPVRTGSPPGDDVRTLTFASLQTTIMVQVTAEAGGRRRLDGWVDPPGPGWVRLRLRRIVHRAPVSRAGRFHVTGLPGGTMQLALVDETGEETLVTPAFEW